MNEDLSKKILERIEKDNIQPKARWKFALKNDVSWGIALLLLIISAIALSVTIYSLNNTDADLYAYSDEKSVLLYARALPYFWILLLMVLSVVVFLYVRHTRHGYKYATSMILVSSVGIIVVFGFVLHVVGASTVVESSVEEHIPVYSKYFAPHHSIWMHPDRGFLAGKVIEIPSDAIITIDDIHGTVWFVETSDAIYVDNYPVQVGRVIKIVGEVDGDNYFVAEYIKAKPENYPFGKPRPMPMPAPAPRP